MARAKVNRKGKGKMQAMVKRKGKFQAIGKGKSNDKTKGKRDGNGKGKDKSNDKIKGKGERKSKGKSDDNGKGKGKSDGNGKGESNSNIDFDVSIADADYIDCEAWLLSGKHALMAGIADALARDPIAADDDAVYRCLLVPEDLKNNFRL